MKSYLKLLFFILIVFFFLGGAGLRVGKAVTVEEAVTITATVPAPLPPPSSGGGGGGFAPPPSTNIVFSGRAYPNRTVTLLKDATIVTSAIAGSDGTFKSTVSGLSAGNYIFSLYSEDKNGIRSSLLTFPVSVTAGATTAVSGIFIAPTIDVDKTEVKRGDNIVIFGQSSPQADILIQVSSHQDFFANTVADKDGIYLYNFNTAVLERENHITKSKASTGNQLISSFGRVVSFKVGTKNVAKTRQVQLKGDSNGDGKVNLVDFSIAAFWYKRPSPPAAVDANSDGKVDLVDFSIMAFFWTG